MGIIYSVDETTNQLYQPLYDTNKARFGRAVNVTEPVGEGPTTYAALTDTIDYFSQPNVPPPFLLLVGFNKTSVTLAWESSGFSAFKLTATLKSYDINGFEYIAIGDPFLPGPSTNYSSGTGSFPGTEDSKVNGWALLYAHKKIVVHVPAKVVLTLSDAQTITEPDVSRGVDNVPDLYCAMGSSNSILNSQVSSKKLPAVLRMFLTAQNTASVVIAPSFNSVFTGESTAYVTSTVPKRFCNAVQWNATQGETYSINTSVISAVRSMMEALLAADSQNLLFQINDRLRSQPKMDNLARAICNSTVDAGIELYDSFCACLGRKGVEDKLKEAFQRPDMEMRCVSRACQHPYSYKPASSQLCDAYSTYSYSTCLDSTAFADIKDSVVNIYNKCELGGVYEILTEQRSYQKNTTADGSSRFIIAANVPSPKGEGPTTWSQLSETINFFSQPNAPPPFLFVTDFNRTLVTFAYDSPLLSAFEVTSTILSTETNTYDYVSVGDVFLPGTQSFYTSTVTPFPKTDLNVGKGYVMLFAHKKIVIDVMAETVLNVNNNVISAAVEVPEMYFALGSRCILPRDNKCPVVLRSFLVYMYVETEKTLLTNNFFDHNVYSVATSVSSAQSVVCNSVQFVSKTLDPNKSLYSVSVGTNMGRILEALRIITLKASPSYQHYEFLMDGPWVYEKAYNYAKAICDSNNDSEFEQLQSYCACLGRKDVETKLRELLNLPTLKMECVSKTCLEASDQSYIFKTVPQGPCTSYETCFESNTFAEIRDHIGNLSNNCALPPVIETNAQTVSTTEPVNQVSTVPPIYTSVVEPEIPTPVVESPPVEPEIPTPVVASPPVASPPVASPPVASPPVASPPVASPPVASPPVASPPVASPPVAPASPPVTLPVVPPLVLPSIPPVNIQLNPMALTTETPSMPVIIGASVGGIIGLALLITLIVFLVKRYRR